MKDLDIDFSPKFTESIYFVILITVKRESGNCSLWSSTPIRFPTKRLIQSPIITSSLTSVEQLQQITGNNGKVLVLSGLKNPYPGADLCVIKESAFADIIIVNGDPTKDIRLLMDAEKNIDLIMKDGKIHKNTI